MVKDKTVIDKMYHCLMRDFKPLYDMECFENSCVEMSKEAIIVCKN